MEQVLLSVFESGITPRIAMTMVQLLIVLFVMVSVRQYFSNLVARRHAHKILRNHKYLTVGCWVRLPTSNGSVDGEIIRITLTRVVIKTEETFEHIPILQFVNGRKSILKCRPTRGYSE